MTQCKRCIERGTPKNFGSEPECGFYPTGIFKSDNWNCATLNKLREVIQEKYEDKIVYSRDERLITIPLDHNPEDTIIEADFLIVGWYKQRGRTQTALLISEERYYLVKLKEIEQFIEHHS